MQMSKSAVQRLGKRLEVQGEDTEEALILLEDWLFEYDELLSAARGVVDELCDALEWPLGVTHRLKTTDTLVQKLRRAKDKGSSTNLARIQDIAGIRVSGAITLTEQEELRDWIIERFESQGHTCTTKDRRIDPVVGYRAIHVIVTIDGRYVEIQIRTTGQDLWANVFERIADIFGRGIRYGEPPESGGEAVLQVIRSMESISAKLYDLECMAYAEGPAGSNREATLSAQQSLLSQLHDVLGYTEEIKGRLSS
ncbi:hypothetical protein ACIRP3_33805 [Streptomyces sp. NPDC101209]|uniref:hypothetical protein n=1 Tax=Streptomyces sp. NPDC101209 TaxID=3366129 RepID=UPI0037F7CE50